MIINLISHQVPDITRDTYFFSFAPSFKKPNGLFVNLKRKLVPTSPYSSSNQRGRSFSYSGIDGLQFMALPQRNLDPTIKLSLALTLTTAR